MTAQEVYDDLLNEKIKCEFCKHIILFSQVEEWIEPEGGACNIVCPNCGQGERIDNAVIKEKMVCLVEIDKKIANKILNAAEAGKVEDKQSYKIAMIIKYHLRFKPNVFSNHPLSYVDRVAMRLVYDELVASEAIQPICIYEARAPVPIDWNTREKAPVKSGKTVPPTFKGLGASQKPKKKGGKRRPAKGNLSFGFTKPKPKPEGD